MFEKNATDREAEQKKTEKTVSADAPAVEEKRTTLPFDSYSNLFLCSV